MWSFVPLRKIEATVSPRARDADSHSANSAGVIRREKPATGGLIETYEDRMSGAKDGRPDSDRLFADVRRRKFDVIVVWRFDRFARSTSQLLRALEEFQSLGVDFVSVTEGIDTSTRVLMPTLRARVTIAVQCKC